MEMNELQTLRHSASHLLAQAVKRLYPGTKLAIGPAIDTGFYYDFDCEHTFTMEDLEKLEAEMKKFYPEKMPIDRSALLSYAMYPKVFEEYIRHRKEYGYIMRMGSHVFFNGMALGETNKINIEDGKTLVIKYLGLGDHNSDGTINVQFELNGMRREVTVRDPHASEQTRQATLADESDPLQVGTSIPGMVSKLCVKQGDHVEKDQVLIIIEAMKMETAITARTAGTVKSVRVKEGQPVKAKELLMELE